MKKINLFSILTLFVTLSVYGQITYNETLTIQPSAYGPKLILNDINTGNKVPIEFRSNNIVKWELGTRSASEQYDLALWRYFNGSYSSVIWFNQDNGDVGIGTNNPTSKLEIQSEGAHYSGEGSLTIKDITNRGTMVLESVLDQPTDFVFKNNNRLSWVMSTRGSSDNYALRFFPSQNGNNWTNPVMSLLTNGNVGIGTSNPDMKLTVKGKIHAEEVKIDLNVPAPDYVFKRDYNLRSIEEVENFIKQYNHLPEIPSAMDFEQNGIMQAEMDMNLLKKIEELTLYTIQQQKEIEELKFLVSSLLESKK